MLVRILLLSFSLALVSPQITAQNQFAAPRKATFLNKDIFQSAVFIQNDNIVDNSTGEDIRYFTSHDRVKAYFTPKGIIYQLTSVIPESKAEKEKREEKERNHQPGEKQEEKITHTISNTIRMDWVGANPNPEIVSEGKAEGYHTYLKNDASGKRTVTGYGYKSITYKDIYPGIDAVYYFPEKGGMKYDLVVHPGADPTVVKFKYGGSLKHVQKDAEGNLVVHTDAGDLIEHAPLSLASTEITENATLPSAFSVKNNTVQFSFPNGFDKSKGLTIDPWITSLTTIPPENMGFSVDYDASGDLFIYGAGPTSLADLTDFFDVAQYTNTGSFSWVFTCSVPAITWNSTTPGSFNYASNLLVDKVTGKVYIGQGYEPSTGVSVIRLNTSGQWDNFASVPNTNFVEVWGFAYNCAAQQILALGGGTTYWLNMGVVDPNTGAVATSNITGITGTNLQDIISGTYDSAGNLYVIMNSNATPLPFTNTIYKVNSAFNGNVWPANSTFTTYQEANNVPYWSADAGNWFNGLAANGSYLYYYDGSNLKAFDFTTGAQVGNGTTIAGFVPKMQGGIAVDYCNNVYVGGIGVIKTFTFDGTNFNPGADISFGGAFASDGINDVRYNATTNQLYVTGNGIVGTCKATLSTTCNPVGSFTVSTTSTCSSVTVNVSPSPNLNPKVFSYIWTDSVGNIVSQLSNSSDTTNTVTGLNPGQHYYIQVQWNTNCGGSAVNDSALVTNCSQLNIQPQTICLGNSATLTAHPTVGGGTYVWTPGGATTDSITVSPIVTTTYHCTYTPPAGPPVTDSAKVTVIAPPTLSINTASVCNGVPAVLVGTPSAIGGTYSWSPGGGATNSITVSPASSTTYHLTYTLSGCSVTDSSTVTVNPPPTLALQDVGPHCGIPNNGVIYATGGGGVSPYQYSLDSGAYQAADSFTSVTAGTFTIVVKDATGCVDTSTISVTATGAATLTLVADSTNCNGNNGKIIATPGGVTPPYIYSLNNGAFQPSSTFNGLGPGTYTVKIKDAQGCTGTAAATVIQPPPATLSLIADSALCFGAANGQVIATATTGVSPYQFALNNGAWDTTSSFSGLLAGSYTVQIMGADGCTGSANITVPQPTQLTLSLSAVNVSCNGGSNGQVAATAAGGIPAYQYSLNGGPTQPTGTYTGLIAGAYSVIVTDVNACTATAATNVTEPSVLTLSLTTQPVTCFGTATGSIDLIPTGGTTPYQYSINGGANQASDAFTNLIAGNYMLMVTDANACTAIDSATITQPTLLAVTLVTDSAKCFGGSTGQITATATGGTVQYQYSLNNGTSQATSVFNNLSAGNYTVVVTDNNACTANATTTVGQPTAVQISEVDSNISCFGVSDGQIAATVTGGSPAYTYAWSNGQSSQNVTGLAVGTYQLTVTDFNACTATAATTLTQPPLLTLTGTTVDVSCFGYSDGSITTSSVGGTVPYSFAWNDAVTSQNRAQIAAGNYSVTVDDSHGCTVSGSYVITQPTQLATGTGFINPTCASLPPDGNITLLPSGGTGPYQYLWSNNQSSQNLHGLVPGPYSVTITDAHNCTIDTSFTLSYIYDFSVVASPNATVQLGKSVTLNYDVAGTVGAYTGVWDPATYLSCNDCVNPVCEPLFTTVYTVEVTNSAGCIAKDVITITVNPEYNIFVPNVFSPNGDGKNDFFEVFGDKYAWKQFQIAIFNRWGEKVYESDDMNFQWDGMYKGKLLPASVYVYEIHVVYLDDHTAKLIKGSVTIIR